MRTTNIVITLMLCFLFSACGAQAPVLTSTLTPTQDTTDGSYGNAVDATADPGMTAAPTLVSTSTEAFSTYDEIPYYGEDVPEARLDVYLPAEGEGPYPTVVYVTPPAAPEKLAMRAFAPHLTEQGYALVALEIRPENWSVDSFCGLAWVYANAGEYRFDTQHIVAFGYSGSGALVALFGTVDSNADIELMKDCPYPKPEGSWVEGVITYEGVFGTPVCLPQAIIRADAVRVWGLPLAEIDEVFNAMMVTPVASWHDIQGLTDQQRFILERNPLYWIDGSEPPFLLIYGSKTDIPWMEEEQIQFATYLTEAGASVEVVRKEGFAHGSIGGLADHTEEIDVFLAEIFAESGQD